MEPKVGKDDLGEQFMASVKLHAYTLALLAYKQISARVLGVKDVVNRDTPEVQTESGLFSAPSISSGLIDWRKSSSSWMMACSSANTCSTSGFVCEDLKW